MRDQSLAIRVKQVVASHSQAGEAITTVAAIKEVLEERGLTRDQALDLAAQALKRTVTDSRPADVPESTESLFDVHEPLRIHDGDNGHLWVSPDIATVGQVDQENVESLQWIETQRLRRRRRAKDLVKIREAADGDDDLNFKAARRMLTDGSE